MVENGNTMHAVAWGPWLNKPLEDGGVGLRFKRSSTGGSGVIDAGKCEVKMTLSLPSSSVMYNFGGGPRFAYVSASARAPK